MGEQRECPFRILELEDPKELLLGRLPSQADEKAVLIPLGTNAGTCSCSSQSTHRALQSGSLAAAAWRSYSQNPVTGCAARASLYTQIELTPGTGGRGAHYVHTNPCSSDLLWSHIPASHPLLTALHSAPWTGRWSPTSQPLHLLCPPPEKLPMHHMNRPSLWPGLFYTASPYRSLFHHLIESPHSAISPLSTSLLVLSHSIYQNLQSWLSLMSYFISPLACMLHEGREYAPLSHCGVPVPGT